MTQQTAECTFALVAAGIAILIVGVHVDALAFAARLAGGAAPAALPIAARCNSLIRSGEGSLTTPPMVCVTARIDAARPARDERQLALELALSGLARGGGVQRRGAVLAAATAIG